MSVLVLSVAAEESVPELDVSSANTEFELVIARPAATSNARSTLLFICSSGVVLQMSSSRAPGVQLGARSISLIARLVPNEHAPESLRYLVCKLRLRSHFEAQRVSMVMLLCAGRLLSADTSERRLAS